MLRVAVCDDEMEMLSAIGKSISACCEENSQTVELELFSEPTKLLERCRVHLFDAIFLDIDMPELNGMSLAEKIRTENNYVKIIFVTNKDDCVFSAYKYGVFRFVRKLYIEQELNEAVTSLITHFNALNEFVELKSPSGMTEVKISSVIFIEALGHNLFYHCQNGTINTSGTIRACEKTLTPKGFIRIHKSFLVNFRYIYSVDITDVVLNDGRKLPLSRKRADETKTKLQIFTRSIEL